MPLVTATGAFRNEEQDGRYCTVLKDAGDSSRVLVMWVGQLEAYAIQGGLIHARQEPPETFFLFADILKELQAQVTRVVIDALKNEVFHASILYESQRGPHKTTARPSDAINLAIRTNAQIFVADDLWEQYSVTEDAWVAAGTADGTG